MKLISYTIAGLLVAALAYAVGYANGMLTDKDSVCATLRQAVSTGALAPEALAHSPCAVPTP